MVYIDDNKCLNCYHFFSHTSEFLFSNCSQLLLHSFTKLFLKTEIYAILISLFQVVEDGYEFFAKRRLVTLFSAPNYGGEFDNAGALLSVDESLVCSFEILKPAASTSKMPLKKVYIITSLFQPKLLIHISLYTHPFSPLFT